MTSEAELLGAIYADPESDEPRALYADFLGERGHPLGELIALQLARASGRRGNKRREQALLDQHGHTFWPGHPGVFAGYVPALAFLDRGFPCRAFNVWFSDMEARVPATVGAPGWATVKTFSVGEWSAALVRGLLLTVPMPLLESVEGLPPQALGAISDEEWSRFPRLGAIQLSGRYADINAAVAAIGPGLRARLVAPPPTIVGDRGSLALKLRPLPRPKANKKVTAQAKASSTPPRTTAPAAAFWEELLASDPRSDAHRHLGSTADKTIAKLAPGLPAALVERIYVYYLSERPYALWPALARVDDAYVAPLVRALERAEPSYEAQLALASHRAGGADGLRAVGAFADFIRKSTNLPGLYKRLPQLVASDALLDGIEEAVVRFDTDDEYGVPILPFYASLFLLERARPRAKAWAALDEKCARWGETATLERARAAARREPSTP